MKERSKNIHTNSTGTNIVNLNKVEAWSYVHWQYLSKTNGIVVFNNHNYSKTTNKHQCETRGLLAKQGIEVDLTLNFTPRSLDDGIELALHNEIHLIKHKQQELQDLIDKPKSRKTTNETRLQQIYSYQYDINFITTLIL